MRKNISININKDKITLWANLFMTPVMKNKIFFSVIFICIVCIPVLSSIILNLRIFHFILSSALQGLFTAYILSLLITFVTATKLRIILQCVLGAPFIIWTITEISCVATTGQVLSDNSVLVIFETNINETKDFLHQYFIIKSLIFIMLYAVSSFFLTWGTVLVLKFLEKNSVVKSIVAVFMLFSLAGGASEYLRLFGFVRAKDENQFIFWSGTAKTNPDLANYYYVLYSSPIVKGGYCLKSYLIEGLQMKRWSKYQQGVLQNNDINNLKLPDFDLVVIIGESFIRSHSSEYGYYLMTNPHLHAEAEAGRLFTFKDVVSPANVTTISIRNTLNLNDVSQKENWYETPYLPLIMKLAGYKVYHFDNQTASRTIDVGLSRMFYDDVIKNEVLDCVNDRTFNYDGDFVNYARNLIKNSKEEGSRFVIYHLLGQHFKCSERFPGNPFFKSSDVRTHHSWIGENERQFITDYNNATLYNDSIVSNIFKSFSDGRTIIIYFSDHGEDTYEIAPVKARTVHSPEDAAWLERQFHIPFFVWMSDEFKKSYPEKVEAVKEALNRPWSTDNLGQMILGLCNIKTKYYRPERDILNDKFKPYKRVTASGYKYDSICSK